MSRYPTMPGREPEMRAAYDTTLLTYAPQVSRQDRQQGYDIDILERQPVPMNTGYRPHRRPVIDLDHPTTFQPTVMEQDRRSDTNAATSAPLPPLPPFESTPSYEPRNLSTPPPPLLSSYDYGRRVPWWRTKKGMIGLGIGIVIFLGIITGVVAGVVSAQKRNSARLDDGSSPLNDVTAPVFTPTATPSALPSSTPQLDVRPGPPEPVTSIEPVSGGNRDDDDDDEPSPPRNNNDDDDDDEEEEEVVTTPRRRPTPTVDDDVDAPPRPTVIASTKPAICASFPNIPACQ